MELRCDHFIALLKVKSTCYAIKPPQTHLKMLSDILMLGEDTLRRLFPHFLKAQCVKMYSI